MKVHIKLVEGSWDLGYVLDKHTISSVCVGQNEYGHPVFETTRTEVGEATYQLKYRSDWAQSDPLATAVAKHLLPLLPRIGFIVPMPASNRRLRQPVSELAAAIGAKAEIPVFHNLLAKKPGGVSLKNLTSKQEKLAALKGAFGINDEIGNNGQWNVLLFDDLFHTGASAEAATAALRTYAKVKGVYFAGLTWR